MTRRTRTLVLAASAAVAVLTAGVLLRPPSPSLSPATTGDAELTTWIADHLGDGARDELVAAVVTPDGVRFAGFGADESTEVEIGSVTKTMTALLLAQSASSGTVSLDDRAADHAELGDLPATLEELATHRSGLPRLPGGVGVLGRSLLSQLRGSDPYAGYSDDDVLRHAAEATRGDGTVLYSNLGAATLGQVLSRAEGAAYADLLQERILAPLGMTSTRIPTTADALGPDAPTGYSATGRSVDAWAMEGYAPAGGVRSTAADMARYAQALLTDDPTLGVAADEVLAPRHEAGDLGRIGLAWLIADRDDGGETTWHNGGTAGYSTMLAMDRERGVAVFVNGNTATSVDELGMSLLAHVLEEES